MQENAYLMKVLFPFWEKAFTNYIVILTKNCHSNETECNINV